MAKQVINAGSYDLDPTAEKVRTAFGKVNTMMDDLYNPLEVVIGTETDNVTINQNGIKFNGTATIFDDVRYDSLSLQRSGPGISLNLPECTVDFASNEIGRAHV